MARRSFPGPAPHTNLFQNPAAEKSRQQVERPTSKRKSAPSQNSRSIRRSRLIEQLEDRKVFAAPTLGNVPTSISMYAGAPYQIGIDGIDADGDALTYTVNSNNSSVTAEYRASTNRSLVLNITHTSSGAGDPAFSGRMVFELFDDLAPITAGRIADITNAGDYDGVIFHRIINNFVIQGGDPTGTGTGGSGPRFDDEFNTQLMHTVSGLLSMANSGNDTNTSQFFVTEGTSSSLRNLDFNHSIFGMITEDVITSGAGVGGSLREAISNLHNPSNEAGDFVDGNGKPAGAVTITSAKIINDKQNRVLTIKAPDGYTGNATITITANDGNGGTVTKTVAVNVAQDIYGDARPFLVDPPKSISIATNGSYTNTLQSADADGQGAAIYAISSFDSTKLTATINQSTGQFTLTPVNGFTGVVNIVVGVTNSSGSFGSEAAYDGQVIQVCVGITPPTAPATVTLVSGSDTGSSDSDLVTNKNNSAAAGANGQLTFRVTGLTTGATVRLMAYGQIIAEVVATGTTMNITTNRASLPQGSTFDLGPNGLATQAIRKITAVQVLKNQPYFYYDAEEDEHVQTTTDVVSQPTAELAITVDDIAPTFSTTSPTRFNEGTAYTYNPTTNEEGNTGHVYTLVNAPTGMTINATTGVVSWTPDAGQIATGGTSFSIRATDLAGNSKDQAIVLTINKKPVFTSSPNLIANEGGTYSYDAATNEDVNGGMVYSLDSTIPGMGIVASTGVVTWTPTAAQVTAGTANVTIRVTDTEGAFQLQTFTITINLKPVFTSTPVLAANEGGSYVYDASTDKDGNAGLVYSLDNPKPANMTVDSSTGIITWIPNAAQAAAGTASVTLRATDANGAFQLQTFTIVINSKPDIINSPTLKVNEGAEFQYDANSDEDGANGLVYSLDDFPTGMTIDAGTGVVSWTPDAGQIANGSDSFTIRVTDAEGAFSTKTFTITINHAPTLGTITDKTTDEFLELVVPGIGADIDAGDTLTYSLVNPIDGVTINSATGEVRFTPTEAQGGTTVTIVVRVKDSGNMTADTSFQVQVNETNTLPVVTTPAPTIRLENGESVDAEIIATDSDVPSQTLVYEILSFPAGLANSPLITQSPNSNPRLAWTPDPADGIGPFEFVIRVSDGIGFKDITITVTQNVPPVFDPVVDQTASEKTPFSFTPPATDENVGDTLRYELIGTVPGNMAINSATGQITWTPTEADGGTVKQITVRVYDDNNRFDEVTFNINVNETNETPVISNPPGPQKIKLGDTLTLDINATDSDTPSQTLTYHINYPASLNGNPPSINAQTGEVTWTPTAADGIGPFTFEVYVNDGVENSASVTFTVQVNHPPVFVLIGPQDASEGNPFTLQLQANDPNGDPLTYSPISALPSGLQISTSGLITWTPGETAGGSSFSFLIRVTDGDFTADQTITINVAETNNAPVAGNNPLVTINEGATAEFTVNATDSDTPAQTLTYSLVTFPAGATIDTATGKVTWASTENDGGSTKTFVIRVSDGITSTDITVQVKVNEVNTLPVLTVGNNHTVNEGSQLTINATATDSDAPTQTLTYSFVNAPAGMTINPATGVITWTPTEVQGPGVFELQVKVTDSEGGSATANIKITVNEVNTNPVLAPISNRTVLQGGTISIGNSATDADLPTQTLTYSLDQAPDGVTINAVTGQISWNVPANQAVGVQEIIVRVTDSAGGSSTQSFLLEVLEFSIGNFLAIFPQGTITNVPPVDFTQFSFGQQFLVMPTFSFNALPTQVQSNVVDNGIVNSGMGRLQGINEEIRIEDGQQKVYKPELPPTVGSETSSQTPAPNANESASLTKPDAPATRPQNTEEQKSDVVKTAAMSKRKMQMLHAQALANFTRSDLVIHALESGSSVTVVPTVASTSTATTATNESRATVNEESSNSSALPAIAMVGAAVVAKSIAPRGKSAGFAPQSIPVPSTDLSQKRKSRWSWFGK